MEGRRAGKEAVVRDAGAQESEELGLEPWRLDGLEGKPISLRPRPGQENPGPHIIGRIRH